MHKASKIFKNPKMILNISIDGNISSGKSTVVNKLNDLFSSCKETKVEIVPEPLDKWCNLKGHNLLDLFYEDPVKNNFIFQHYVQLTRLMDSVKKYQNIENMTNQLNQKILNNGLENNKIRLLERSIQNNRHCFVELSKKEGRIHPAEYSVLVQWYNWIENNLDINLDLILYLKTSPEVVYKRMKSRGRKEEGSVPFDYLKNLHEKYEEWLGSNSKSIEDLRGPKVIVVDANQSQEEVSAQCRKLVLEFLSELNNEIEIIPPPSSPTIIDR